MVPDWRVHGVFLPQELPPPLPPPGAPLFPWPHPNFWWAIPWCLGYLFCTQLPAGILAAVLLVAVTMILRHRPQGPEIVRNTVPPKDIPVTRVDIDSMKTVFIELDQSSRLVVRAEGPCFHA